MTTRAEYLPLVDFNFLLPGTTWPPPSEVFRLDLVSYNRALYQNDHSTLLDSLLAAMYLDTEELALVTPTTVNLYKALSTLWGDLLFCEIPQIKSDGNDDPILTEITNRTRFWETSRKVAIDVSRYGTGIYKVYLKEGESVIQSIRPDIWFPVVSPDNINEEIAHVIAYKVFKTEVQEGGLFGQNIKVYDYIKVEIHTKGYIEHSLYPIGNTLLLKKALMSPQRSQRT